MADHKICIATVALEPNRWGSKEPSFNVSDWLDRFEADGFDGVELWENHFVKASSEEQEELERAAPIAVFNSYAGFADSDAEGREKAAEAAKRLKASAVKYNFGYDKDRTAEFQRNLMEWEKELPADCNLLCECHEGTALDTVEASRAVFDKLDPDRFGIIVHAGPDGAKDWFDAFGKRIQHVHIQLRGDETDPSTPEGKEVLHASLSRILDNGFDGSFAVEFTRGIGKEENIEEIYANACSDMSEIRAILGSVQ